METRFDGQDIELLERKVSFQGFFRLETLHLRHRCFAGGWSKTLRRELFVRGDAVAVQLYDPDTDRVAFVEQFRVGAMKEPTGPWLLEPVAGMIEAGETPEEVAVRESAEEAGLTEVVLHPIGAYLPSPGGCDERIYLFCGCADLSSVEGIYGLPEEGEDIQVRTMSLDEALGLLWENGILNTRMNNSATIIALQWLHMNRDQLRHREPGS